MVFIVAGLFFFIRPLPQQSGINIQNQKNVYKTFKTDEKEGWIKDFASKNLKKESYFYPVREIYINLD